MDSQYHNANSLNYRYLKYLAKEQRNNQTEAESALWKYLRKKGLGYRFLRQYALGDYIVDFICFSKRLTIEVDGEYHLNQEQKIYDQYRTQYINKIGFTEIRFTNNEVLFNTDMVIDTIQSYLDNEGAKFLPSKGEVRRGPHIIILGDGMADHAVERLGGRTLLQYAHTPYMDLLAKNGRCGLLATVPKGYSPGSEVANTAILGYDLDKVYEGRGPLEAASIGYEMEDDDMAIRCNIIALKDGRILNHHGNHLTTEKGTELIQLLESRLGTDRIKFIPGIQYRHLLVIKGGNKHIVCNPPHDHPDEEWTPLLPFAEGEGKETAELLLRLIIQSQEILPEGLSIWPWSPGYRPKMTPLTVTFPQIRRGAVITAVDLIRGIGHYAGLRCINVEGATGLADTNYEGKAQAAIEALKTDDFVFLHLEASDEAGHDGDLDLKIKTIEYLDDRIIRPIYEAFKDKNVTIAVLPDHPTPVEIRTHLGEPVPFLIWNKDIEADAVQKFDELSCKEGSFGLLENDEFINAFMEA